MMRHYAQETSVSVDRSRMEIEALVIRAGATAVQTAWSDGLAAIGFCLNGRVLRFRLPLPTIDAEDFAVTPTARRRRDERTQRALWEQACRARWRALFISIKAKLAAVAEGIAVFDTEFLGNIVDPATDKTVGELVIPQLTLTYEQKPKHRKPIGLLTDAPA